MILVRLEAFTLVPLPKHAIFAAVSGNFSSDVSEGGHDGGRLTHFSETTFAHVNGRI